MLYQKLVVGPFQSNCFLLLCPQSGQGVLIDPGGDAARILKTISNMQEKISHPIIIRHLFHTHGHLDHIQATREIKLALTQSQKGDSPSIYLHRADEDIYFHLSEQAKLFGLPGEHPLSIDSYFEEGQEIKVGQLCLSVIHTPGHSPGGVSIRLHPNFPLKIKEMIFSGDTLFQGGIGRTDLWGGNMDTLLESIKTRLFTLSEEVQVCPGHGPDTTIGIEKRENPFFQ